MGRALLQGAIAAGVVDPQRLTVVDPDANSQAWWTREIPAAQVTEDCRAGVTRGEIVILAVKPQTLGAVAATPADWDQRLTISVAAGIQLAQLQSQFGTQRIVRVMPNTPSLIAAGAAAFCCGPQVTAADAEAVERLFTAVGLVARVPEHQMDAVTAVSGSGPAYVFLIIEALADGGVAAGLPRDLALRLATQTVAGAAQLVRETGEHPGALKDAVASPGGTTIAGLHSLDQNAVRGAMIDAVQAAARRSRELGSG